MIRYIIIQFVFITAGFTHTAYAQTLDTLLPTVPMDYTTFISTVGQKNIAYAAEQFEIAIADAAIESAKIFPDPQLAFGWFDNGQRRMDMGYGFTSELTWTLELGGKRKARVDLARNQAQLTRHLLEDYFRNLRADATLAYLSAIQQRMLLEVLNNSYQQVKQLAAADSVRYKLGVISQVDARQSKLEAGTLLNEVYAAEAQYATAIAALSLLTADSEQAIEPVGDFSSFDRDLNLPDLLVTALNNRADLKAALQQKHVSASVLKLAKANRAIDLDLSIGASYASYARNIIAPTPSFNTINTGVAIPLKFSNNKPGELRTANYARQQADHLFRQIELEIQTEVTQAFYSYQSAKKQVRQFNTGLLTEARAILDGKIYSYQRGETSLLEVLDAQRTYNEVQQGYYQALYGYAESLIALERASGTWDINIQ